jgi:hypothetical protein
MNGTREKCPTLVENNIVTHSAFFFWLPLRSSFEERSSACFPAQSLLGDQAENNQCFNFDIDAAPILWSGLSFLAAIARKDFY